MLQAVYPQREFDLQIYWQVFSDLDDGEVFKKVVYEICRDTKETFPPPPGAIRERYFDMKKRTVLSLPDTRERFTSQPPDEFKKLLARLSEEKSID